MEEEEEEDAWIFFFFFFFVWSIHSRGGIWIVIMGFFGQCFIVNR